MSFNPLLASLLFGPINGFRDDVHPISVVTFSSREQSDASVPAPQLQNPASPRQPASGKDAADDALLPGVGIFVGPAHLAAPASLAVTPPANPRSI